MKVIGLIFICWLLLSACGNKGDLYLPEKETSASKALDTNINQEQQK